MLQEIGLGSLKSHGELRLYKEKNTIKQLALLGWEDQNKAVGAV